MKNYECIGVMSGTSLDGLDIAACSFHEKNNKWGFEIIKAETIPYPTTIKEALISCNHGSSYQLATTDQLLGEFIGKKVGLFKKSLHMSPLFVASHGHTIFHEPENRLTLQIGNGYEIAHFSQLPVYNQFRNLDVSLGGQGAPLVPVGDKHLFSSFEATLNLGGFANITLLKDPIRAYDICPVNYVFNYLANKTGYEYDENGQIAKSGTLNKDLFDTLNLLPYYSLPSPKSLGREWVEKNIFPLMAYTNIPIQDLMHTFCHHATYQIAHKIENAFQPNHTKILVTGGGAYNAFMIHLLNQYKKPHIEFIIPDKIVVEYKEALIFAFLGLLRHLNITNTYSTVTGALRGSCGGAFYKY